jgi:hypothetical protein
VHASAPPIAKTDIPGGLFIFLSNNLSALDCDSDSLAGNLVRERFEPARSVESEISGGI